MTNDEPCKRLDLIILSIHREINDPFLEIVGQSHCIENKDGSIRYFLNIFAKGVPPDILFI